MKRLNYSIFFVVALLCAMLLEIMPLPHWALMWRPNYLFLLVLFLTLYRPQYMNLLLIWGVGLMGDLLTTTVLGQHALAFVVIMYGVIHFRARWHHFLLWQQLLLVCLVTLLQLIIQALVMSWVGEAPNWMYYMSIFTTTLIWPLCYYLLHHERRAIAYYT